MTETPDRIPRFPVTSSSIAAIGYLEAKKILAIEFAGGGIYHFADVEPDVVLALIAASSIGGHFAKHIKGKHAGLKMTGICLDCGDKGWIGDTCEDCGCSPYVREPRKGSGE